MNCAGRKPNIVRDAYIERFNLPLWRRADHWLNDRLLCQLSLCRSDEARRLLLGVSR
jgi:hypothetical protein